MDMFVYIFKLTTSKLYPKKQNFIFYTVEPESEAQRVPPVKACHMAMTPICLIFWSLIDNVEELLCANFQPQIAFC